MKANKYQTTQEQIDEFKKALVKKCTAKNYAYRIDEAGNEGWIFQFCERKKDDNSRTGEISKTTVTVAVAKVTDNEFQIEVGSGKWGLKAASLIGGGVIMWAASLGIGLVFAVPAGVKLTKHLKNRKMVNDMIHLMFPVKC